MHEKTALPSDYSRRVCVCVCAWKRQELADNTGSPPWKKGAREQNANTKSSSKDKGFISCGQLNCFRARDAKTRRPPLSRCVPA